MTQITGEVGIFTTVVALASGIKTPHTDTRTVRRLLSHAFSEKALTAQTPLINSYVDKLINNLRRKSNENGRSTIVDIVKWYNYTTFDILGELAFGEPFRCFEDDAIHPWIRILFASVKDGSLVKIANTLPQPMRTLLKTMIPKSNANAAKEEYIFATKKVKARIQAGEAKKVDFMSYILKHNDERGMTMPEIESNAVILILAGSETSMDPVFLLLYADADDCDSCDVPLRPHTLPPHEPHSLRKTSRHHPQYLHP